MLIIVICTSKINLNQRINCFSMEEKKIGIKELIKCKVSHWLFACNR